MQNITPFLWFDNNLEEAINFYTAIFPDSLVKQVSRYGEGAPFPPGTVMSATFQLNGVEFMALNGGPQYAFSAAISFFIKCEAQDKIDYYWEKLGAGGEPQRCGWLKDKFGITWQIVPPILGKLLGDPDPAKAKRVLDAMLGMQKLDIQKLLAAHAG